MEKYNKLRLLRLMGGIALIGGTCLFFYWYHPDYYPVIYPHVLSFGALIYLSTQRDRYLWWGLLLLATVAIWWFAKAPSMFIAIFAVAKLAPLLGLVALICDLIAIYKAQQRWRKT